MAALLNLRNFCREFGWTPEQVLAAPAQLLHDFALLSRYERQLKAR